jgi:phosphonoacetate hydrolase
MLDVNGRSYALPKHPTVVVCVDGCEPDYLAQAVAGGHMPWMKRTLAQARHCWPTAWCPASPTPTT